MLISRAPVRISFAGGGTDLESYYHEHGGLVVSTTIDKYFYVMVSLKGSEAVQIVSADYRTFFRQSPGDSGDWDGDLALPSVFLHQFGIESGVQLFLASEIPPGTGLGSSSTVSVALAKSLSTLCGAALGPHQIAELASHIEIDRLGMPIGRQDQYAAAFGGLNVIRFDPDGTRVESLGLPIEVEVQLERRIMLFYTGASRSAASILKNQDAATRQTGSDAVQALHRIKGMAETTIDLLGAGDLDGFGALLDESWQAKKRLAEGITNSRIDAAYAVARSHGAIGGKIAGAGGGGFLMIYCQEPYQTAVTQALQDLGLMRMDFRFERGGAVVLMDAIPRIRQFGSVDRALAALARPRVRSAPPVQDPAPLGPPETPLPGVARR